MLAGIIICFIIYLNNIYYKSKIIINLRKLNIEDREKITYRNGSCNTRWFRSTEHIFSDAVLYAVSTVSSLVYSLRAFQKLHTGTFYFICFFLTMRPQFTNGYRLNNNIYDCSYSVIFFVLCAFYRIATDVFSKVAKR